MNDQIRDLVKRGAQFVVNHSGGKDSQAMLVFLKRHVPESQLIVVHAHLPGVEWEGTSEHAKRYCGDIPFIEVKAVKTFFEMVEHRKMWPSPKNRQCTSDLKRGPLEKAIRHWIKDNGHNGLIVNCIGIRAQESSARAKNDPFRHSPRNSKAGREWYDWLPIFEWSVEEVWESIRDAGEVPHWAYQKGMSRLSCCFCIMSSKADLKTAAQLNPELYKKYCEMEQKIQHSFVMPTKKGGVKYLPEVTGIAPSKEESAK